MDLKTVSDHELIRNAKNLVRDERGTLISLLHHLREVHRRRLYSTLKYRSLFDFTVRHLGYPEDQASRRIAAMRLLTHLPEVEEKISSGEISLTHIGLAQSHFRQEERFSGKGISLKEKLKVFEMISGKSVREAERTLKSIASGPIILEPDKIRVITESHIEIKFTASNDVEGKIAILKGLLAHQFPNISIGELFDKLCDLGIESWSPSKKTAAPRRFDTKTKRLSQAEIRREIFRRAGNKCENCGSTYALEIEHCHPQALGGDSNLENLKLLCRSCNQRAAINVYGVNKMEEYLSFKGP